MNDLLSISNTIQSILGHISPISKQTAMELALATEIKTLEKDALLETSGQPVKCQFVVKNGIVRKFLTNAKGDEFTTDFFCAGQAITPALLRSVEFVSFVNLQVISHKATVLFFSNTEMEATM